MAERGDLPQGYKWQELVDIQAYFPVPEGWFYAKKFTLMSGAGVDLYIMAREPIPEKPIPLLDMAGKGAFQTGLTIYVFEEVSRKMKTTPTAFARNALVRNALLSPQGEPRLLRDDPLITYRGYYKSGRNVLGHEMYPIKYYGEATGNTQTDTGYLMIFETPEQLWEENKEIAQIMIDRKILSKEV